jgi:DNA-directed RNA polymerase specialized sigma24 family protein
MTLRSRGESGLSPPDGGTLGSGRSPVGKVLHRALDVEGASGGRSSDVPTRPGAEAERSPVALAVGSEVVSRYEAGLARLGRRDREAVRGRIERQRPYDDLADDLGVATSGAARAVVIRALERLLEAMSE